MAYFRIEKTYYDPADFNGAMLTDHDIVLHPTLEEAKARYESSDDPWFTEGEIDGIGISHLNSVGLEIGYTRLDPKSEIQPQISDGSAQ